MPELPEVESSRAMLEKHAGEARIVAVSCKEDTVSALPRLSFPVNHTRPTCTTFLTTHPLPLPTP